jgi:hypothetical protein
MKSHVMASFPGRVGVVGGERDAPRGTFEKVPLGTPQNFWGKYRGFVIGNRL